MKRTVDVAVIGAGHAGLHALQEVRKVTDDWVLIHGGPLGTTRARSGRRSAKVVTQRADRDPAPDGLSDAEALRAEALQIDATETLAHRRNLRERVIDAVLANPRDERGRDHLIEGYAGFTAPNRLRVGAQEIAAGAIVIATGARAVVPAEWRAAFGEGILTVDNLFDQPALPASVAVLGLGPIGIEIGQALNRLGVVVTGIDPGHQVARLTDPEVNRAAVESFSREFPLWLGDEPRIERLGDGFRVRAGAREVRVEKLFLALGHRPSVGRLGLEQLGVPLRDTGVPDYDPATLQVGRLPVYIAGAASGGLATLARAAAQGRIAGYNATHRRPRRFVERTALEIYQAWCLHKSVRQGRRWDRRSRCGHAVPSGVGRGAGRAGARSRHGRRESTIGGDRPARPGGPSARLCAAS